MKRFFLIVSLALLGACAVQAPVHQTPPARQANAATLDARLEKADLAFREARLSEAERLYRAIADAHPSLTEVWVRLGNIYTRQDELDAAIRAYEMALHNDRHEGRAWYNLAVVHLKQSVATLEHASAALPADSPYRRLVDAQRNALLGRIEAAPAPKLAAATAPHPVGQQPNCWEAPEACAGD